MIVLTRQQIKHRAILPAYDDEPTDELLKHNCILLENYLKYNDQIKTFNSEFKSFNGDLNDLDDIRVRNWCLNAETLFDEFTMGFVLDFCDHSASTEELISLNVEEYFIKKQDILDLYVFAKISWMLHFDEYYLAPECRIKPDPNIDDTKSYYYTLPDPMAPSDFQIIKTLIALL